MKRALLGGIVAAAMVLGCGSTRSTPIHVADRSFEFVLDPGAAQDEARTKKALEVARESLAKSLGAMKASYPAAFAREAGRLVRVEARGRSESSLAIVAVLEGPPAEIPCPGGNVADALGQDFRHAVEGRFQRREPEQIAPAEGAEWFDWARLGGFPADVEIGPIARFAVAQGASDPAVGRRARSFLLAQADDLSRAGYGLAPTPPERVALREAYVRWLATVYLGPLDADERWQLVPALFRLPPREQDISYGYAKPEPRAYWHFEGIDPIAFGLASADGWVAAGDTNAIRFWIQYAVATNAGGARLAQAIGGRADTRLVVGIVRELGSDRTTTDRLLRALEPYPRALEAARTAFASR